MSAISVWAEADLDFARVRATNDLSCPASSLAMVSVWMVKGRWVVFSEFSLDTAFSILSLACSAPSEYVKGSRAIKLFSPYLNRVSSRLLIFFKISARAIRSWLYWALPLSDFSCSRFSTTMISMEKTVPYFTLKSVLFETERSKLHLFLSPVRASLVARLVRAWV